MSWTQAITYLIIYGLSIYGIAKFLYYKFDLKYKRDLQELQDHYNYLTNFVGEMNNDMIKFEKRTVPHKSEIEEQESKACPVCDGKPEQLGELAIDGKKHLNYWCNTCSCIITVPAT